MHEPKPYPPPVKSRSDGGKGWNSAVASSARREKGTEDGNRNGNGYTWAVASGLRLYLANLGGHLGKSDIWE